MIRTRLVGLARVLVKRKKSVEADATIPFLILVIFIALWDINCLNSKRITHFFIKLNNSISTLRSSFENGKTWVSFLCQ
jgi:hypothetical protein